MYIGHFGIAFSAKRAEKSLKLGTLILAAEFVDFLFTLLVLIGIEHVGINPGASPFTQLNLYDYPFSHSMLFSVIWAFILGGSFFLLRKNKKGAIIIGFVVFSHWILDFISHTPDLPLIPGATPFVGLGLWNSTAGTLILESTIFAAGIILYFKVTKAKDILGKILPWTLILFLSMTYLMVLISPPPEDQTPLIIGGVIQWLYIPWGYWIDRHRESI